MVAVGDGSFAAAGILPADDDVDGLRVGQMFKGNKVDVGGAVGCRSFTDGNPLSLHLVEDVDPGGISLGGTLVKDSRLLDAVPVDVIKNKGRTILPVLRIFVLQLRFAGYPRKGIADLCLLLGQHRRAHQVLDGGLYPCAAGQRKGQQQQDSRCQQAGAIDKKGQSLSSFLQIA